MDCTPPSLKSVTESTSKKNNLENGIWNGELDTGLSVLRIMDSTSI